MVEQVAFGSLYGLRYGSVFAPMMAPISTCGGEYIYSNIYEGLSNVIRFSYVFQPYYKLVIYAKVLPTFKSVLPNAMGLLINAKMSDNVTNTFTTFR